MVLGGMAMKLLVLLYAYPGQEAVLRAFEDRALAVLGEYGSVQRYVAPAVLGLGMAPDEVHVVEFGGELAYAAYRKHVRTLALGAERVGAVRDSFVLRLS